MHLKICVYNLENFFLQKAGVEIPFNTSYKSLKKVKEIKQVFDDIDADVYALSEVGGVESLNHFNIHYLDDKYTVAHMPGNSDRNIEVAYLVKKELPYKLELTSYRKTLLNFNYPHEIENKDADPNYRLPKHKLSRNLLQLELFDQEKQDRDFANICFFLTHLKSQRDETGKDFKSRQRRKAELEACLKIINEFKLKNEHCPIIFCGDFNGNASSEKTDEEFKKIYDIHHLHDVLELVDLPHDQRATYYLFNQSTRIPTQLDYAFTYPEDCNNVEDACVYRYKNDLGRPKNLPKTKYDLWNNPSDHYPLVFTYEI
jgi:endonuclease/exonuclease/phosphatase family metal-dependent hydrolase